MSDKIFRADRWIPIHRRGYRVPAPAGADDITAVLATSLALAADLDAQGKLDAAHAIALTLAADLDAEGKLEVSIPMSLGTSLGINGSGELAANPVISLSSVAALASVGELASAISITMSVAPSVTADGELLIAAALALSVTASIDGGGAIGDIYNAAASFPTGSSVTIELYHPITLAAIAVDSDVCGELASTGLYVWNSSKLTIALTDYQEYVWRMTDGLTFEGGVIRINAMSIEDLFGRVMENGETYAEQIRLIRADAAGDVVQLADGTYKVKSADGLTDRIEGDDAANSGRTISATDGT